VTVLVAASAPAGTVSGSEVPQGDEPGNIKIVGQDRKKAGISAGPEPWKVEGIGEDS